MKISQEQAAFLDLCEREFSLIHQALVGYIDDFEARVKGLGTKNPHYGAFTSSVARWRKLTSDLENAYENLPVEGN